MAEFDHAGSPRPCPGRHRHDFRGRWPIACLIFIIAGLSDAVDGWLAKTFNLRTELGAYLDPVADKALLVSIYVALSVYGAVPSWLTIAVVARDVMIIGALIISWLMNKPVAIRPLWISKANTAAQIAFAAAVLGAKAFQFTLGPWFIVSRSRRSGIDLASLAAYLALWARHMSL
ncbi:MAG: CDP-alcohol phosphatidyltransferase family protein [Methylovirgula sp.]